MQWPKKKGQLDTHNGRVDKTLQNEQHQPIKSLQTQMWQSRVMVCNATFNNISLISWRSVLFVEETGVHGKNHRPVASYWQTVSHNGVSSTHSHERDSNSQHRGRRTL